MMNELATLVAQARQRDHEAFGALIGRFQDMAFGAAFALVRDGALAEEVAQEAFGSLGFHGVGTLFQKTSYSFTQAIISHSERVFEEESRRKRP